MRPHERRFDRGTLAGLVEWGIRFGLLGVLVEGVRRRKPGAVANAAAAVVATYLPDVLARWRGIELRPWQRVYAQSALLTHALGMLGPYDDVGWWDHLTHFHSATVVGGLLHLEARRRNRDPRVRVLAGVTLGGVLWELGEYAIHVVADRFDREPLLVSYGRDDTAFDLLFDLVGAVFVAVFGDRLLGDGS